MPSYKFARVDSNHRQLRETARAAGYFWVDTYRQGDGAPDAFCLSKAGRWVALEVKTIGGKLTPAEIAAVSLHPVGTPYHVVRTEADLLQLMACYDERERAE